MATVTVLEMCIPIEKVSDTLKFQMGKIFSKHKLGDFIVFIIVENEITARWTAKGQGFKSIKAFEVEGDKLEEFIKEEKESTDLAINLLNKLEKFVN